MKQIWRCCSAAALLVALVFASIVLAPSTSDAQSEQDPSFSCTIHVFHIPTECEVARIQAVSDVVAALESYAGANGTYHVEDSGYLGRGSGWVFWEEAGSRYPVSVARVLTEQGHLPAESDRESLSSSVEIVGDLLVYRCQDRVAVFTRNSTTEPAPSDRDWWTSNGCTSYPIDGLGATYYQVSVKLSLTGSDASDEIVRVESVADMVAALESYAAANGTYLVEGGGSRGRGSGWTFWEEAGSTYPVAIATVLANEGHLPADAARDPLWSSNTAIEGDLLTYRCRDRVAVFTRHSISEPSAFDSSWWAQNGCTSYPFTGLNATYFELSEPLSAH